MKYGGTTVVSTVVGLSVLFLGLEVVDLNRVIANLVSVVASTPFAYFLSRKYVWLQDGDHDITGEMGPFWALNLFGWVYSTVIVWLAGFFSTDTLFLVAAQVTAFGSLWFVKFFYLEKVLWGSERT